MRSLFESVLFGPLVLRNRVFMAPLTRNRANVDGVPSELATGVSGTDYHRGDADFPDGEGLHQHSESLFTGADCCVASHRGRST